MLRPRRPTVHELADLTNLWVKQDRKQKWDDISLSEHFYSLTIVVVDNFVETYPFYNGKLMIVINGIRPRDCTTYVWKDNKLVEVVNDTP